MIKKVQTVKKTKKNVKSNENNKNIIILVILVVVILAMSIGFSVFSKDLKINTVDVTVNATDTFSKNVSIKKIECTGTTTSSVESSGTVSTSTETSWEGIKVSLTDPGSSVTCKITVRNDSAYTAVLKDLKFEKKLECKNAVESTNSSATNLCGENGIKATLSDGTSSAIATGASVTNIENLTNGQIIAPSSEKDLDLIIEYQNKGVYIDTDVKVTIPVITLKYDSSN